MAGISGKGSKAKEMFARNIAPLARREAAHSVHDETPDTSPSTIERERFGSSLLDAPFSVRLNMTWTLISTVTQVRTKE